MPGNEKDTLTLTLRIHDPKEKRDAAKSTSWLVLAVERGDLRMPKMDFIAKYILPNLDELKLLELN